MAIVLNGTTGIGVGTTPSHPLDIEVSSGDGVARIHAAENNNASEARLRLEVSNDFAESIVETYDSSGIGGSLKYNHGDNAWRFSTTGDSADTERMRIDSSGDVGIGTTSPDGRLHIMGGNLGGAGSVTASTSANLLVLESNTSQGLSFLNANDERATIYFGTTGTNGNVEASIQYAHEAVSTTADRRAMIFKTGGNGERMRIGSSGNVNINNTGDLDAYRLAGAGSSVRGHLLRADGNSASTVSQQQFITGNRLDSDGSLITFSQDGNQEGNISVSGSSVSYNGGVLTRWSQLKGISSTDKSARPTIYQGTVMSNLDDLCEWEGEENQQLNMTKISDTVGDKDIAGVFWAWDDDDDKIVNDFYIAMTGDMVIRVAASTTVARGDLLISAGDGTAKPQNDDIVRSSTIAKIISTTFTATYEDGSKAYPCVLMAC